MKDSIVKLELYYGEPQIGRLQVIDGYVEMELLVAGIESNTIKIKACSEKLVLTIEESRHVPKASFGLRSQNLDFRAMDYYKRDGILFITIPILEELKNINITI